MGSAKILGLGVVTGLLVMVMVVPSWLGCASSSEAVRMSLPSEKASLVPSPAYRVGDLDLLDIQVRGHDELRKGVTVRPDGMVTLVLLDDVYVQGLTTAEIDDKLTRMYNQYIVNADVTVTVLANNSQRIYVWGQVFRQGDLPYTGDMTIVDAIARTGGPNQRAEPKRILLTRAGRVHEVNLYNVVVKGKMEDNVYLQDGDIIFVPPTDWARAGMALDNIFYPFRNLFAFLFLEEEVRAVLQD